MPSIYCVGRNYRAHAQELSNEIPQEPLIFLKALPSLRGLEPSPMAFAEESFDHEIEVVLQIGPQAQQLPWPIKEDHKVEAESLLSAITLGLDLTRRQKQSEIKQKGQPWTLAKSFRGSAVLAPWLPAAQWPQPKLESIDFELKVCGQSRQKGNTSDMIFGCDQILRFIHNFSPLCPGDIIYTGTPSGVGPIRVGESFELIMDKGRILFSGCL